MEDFLFWGVGGGGCFTDKWTVLFDQVVGYIIIIITIKKNKVNKGKRKWSVVDAINVMEKHCDAVIAVWCRERYFRQNPSG